MTSRYATEHSEEPGRAGKPAAAQQSEAARPLPGLDAEAAAQTLSDSTPSGEANLAARGRIARSLQRSAGNAAVGRLVGDPGAGGGRALEPSQRQRMEPAFGHDFGGVRLHESGAPGGVDARAVTVGPDIHVAPGAVEPSGTVDGLLLAHELAHVVQQTGATRTAAMTGRGSAPEREAEQAAGRAVRGEPVGALAPAGLGRARAEPELPGPKEAKDFVDYLLTVSHDEAATLIEGIWDSRYLRFVRAEVSGRLEGIDATSLDFPKLHLALALVSTRLGTIADWGGRQDYRADFEALVERIRAVKRPRIPAALEKELRDLLASLSVQQAKELEKIIVLWPHPGHKIKMDRIIEIVTSFSGSNLTDQEESARGLFPDDEEEEEEGETPDGSDLKADLSEGAAEFDNMSCWNFLYEQGLEILYSDKERVATAKKEYGKGAAQRKEETVQGSKTLSRGANELRLEGLLGPVTILPWVGSHAKGHHEPSPAEVVTELSAAGDGWYFFFANVVSFHTMIVAVEVSGSDRTFFVIEAGKKAKRVTRSGLNSEFNDLDPSRGGSRPKHTSKVGSRIWQVYNQTYE